MRTMPRLCNELDLDLNPSLNDEAPESLKYMNGQEPEYNDNTLTSWNELASMSMLTFQELILVTNVTTGGGILFEVGVSFSMENSKFRPVLANFDYLVASFLLRQISGMVLRRLLTDNFSQPG